MTREASADKKLSSKKLQVFHQTMKCWCCFDMVALWMWRYLEPANQDSKTTGCVVFGGAAINRNPPNVLWQMSHRNNPIFQEIKLLLMQDKGFCARKF